MNVDSISREISELEFWRAISVLVKNYHAVNKKISGAKIIDIYRLPKRDFDVHGFKISDNETDLKEIFRGSCIEAFNCSENNFFEAINSDRLGKQEQFILSSKIFYKQNRKPPNQILQLIDFAKSAFYSVPTTSHENADQKLAFSIHFRSGKIFLDSLDKGKGGENNLMLNWLTYVLEPKLYKWSQSADKTGKTNNVKSLNLIDIEEYTNRYSTLKEKYGQDMVERWTESTDPLKFVYEDVAIATYLISLWRKSNYNPRNFVDMGCGNGLLVHILNSEGYNGFGVDIRKRKIWDIYPETTKLKEHTIIPNDYTSFKDVDWIIGNHSDELSPWIPVLAAMSSYNTKYFLLPCCAYEFSGQKFQRRNCETSVYNDFLNYVREISLKCRFETEIDRLKIPSTKRVALIGATRSYPIDEYDYMRHEIEEFVNLEVQKTNCIDLKIREKEEAVRNCTKIDKNIINSIVMIIFEFILKDDDHIERTDKWRCGRSVTLQDLAFHLSKENLKSIKSECGGLKTLIKNKHEIFEVLGDKVKLRYPRRKEDRPKGMIFKKRPCFFFLNHPDGCPLSTYECTFVHERINC